MSWIFALIEFAVWELLMPKVDRCPNCGGGLYECRKLKLFRVHFCEFCLQHWQKSGKKWAEFTVS